jgi:XTP/dITP diphosphohydrolase
MLPDMSRSTAELSPEEKNEISHRGKALRQIAEKLREVLA